MIQRSRVNLSQETHQLLANVQPDSAANCLCWPRNHSVDYSKILDNTKVKHKFHRNGRQDNCHCFVRKHNKRFEGRSNCSSRYQFVVIFATVRGQSTRQQQHPTTNSNRNTPISTAICKRRQAGPTGTPRALARSLPRTAACHEPPILAADH